jgi:hypothetical protein
VQNALSNRLRWTSMIAYNSMAAADGGAYPTSRDFVRTYEFDVGNTISWWMGMVAL